MPPCESVLLNKIKRTQSVTRMIKSCSNNSIYLPEAIDGYCLNENQEYMIEYFSGCPYPESFADLIDDNLKNNNDASSSDEDNCNISSSDEEYEEDIEFDDWKLFED